MKYSEFNNKYPDLELQYTDVMLFIYCEGVMVGKVSKKNRYKMSTIYDGFEKFNESYAANLLMNMHMLAETPLAERKEEKRYWLRKVLIPLLGEESNRYFCKPLLPNYQPCVDGDRRQDSKFQTIFTESEIAEMDIAGFQKVEVTE